VGPNRIDREDQMILVLRRYLEMMGKQPFNQFKSIIIDAGVSMLI